MPIITSFTSDTSIVTLGQPVNFSWNVTGAYRLLLGGQDVTGLNGIAVRPTVNTQYQLYAQNSSGSATSQILTITVSTQPVTITITPTTAALFIGQSLRFGYTLSAPTPRVVWNASAGSVAQDGTFTAPSTPGTCTVTIISVDDPRQSATAMVTVKDIILAFDTPVVNLRSNEAYQFGLTYDIPAGSTLIWATTGGRISQTGYFVPPAGAGTYTVSVACSFYPDRKQYATVHVTMPTVQVLPGFAVLTPNRSLQFQAQVTSGSVTWSVVEPTGGTITSAGLYKAPMTLGTFTVKAVSTLDASQFATAKVLVNSSGMGGTGSGTATGTTGVQLFLSPVSVVMDAGTYYPFEATVTGADDTSVTWQLVNASPDATIDASGVFTAARQGTYQVQATSVADPTVTVQATLVVSPSVKPFDLTTGGPMAQMQGYSVTALKDGRVLIAGGCPFPQPDAQSDLDGLINYVYQAQAWLYDPTTGAFTATGSMLTPRGFHHAVLLSDGRVLMAGGSAQWLDPWWKPRLNSVSPPWAENFPFAEVYDPVSGTFQALPSQAHPLPMPDFFPDAVPPEGAGMMWSNHPWGSALRLSSGKVLITGGDDHGWWSAIWKRAFPVGPEMFGSVEDTDLFDPTTGTFDVSPPNAWRLGLNWVVTSTVGNISANIGMGESPRTVALSDGRVLMMWGNGPLPVFSWSDSQGTLQQEVMTGFSELSAHLLDPATMVTTHTPAMNVPRAKATLTRLADGRILAVGGVDLRTSRLVYGQYVNGRYIPTETTATAEIYDPVANTWTLTGSLHADRAYHAAILLPTGQVQIVGGYKSDLAGNVLYPNTIEVYDPDTGTFSIMDHMDYGLTDPKLVLMGNGGLFMAGEIRAPMEPPATPKKLRWDAEAKAFRAVGATSPNSLVVTEGSMEGWTTAPVADLEVKFLTINQGVERFLDPAKQTAVKWRSTNTTITPSNVPVIAGRPAWIKYRITAPEGFANQDVHISLSLENGGSLGSSSREVFSVQDPVHDHFATCEGYIILNENQMTVGQKLTVTASCTPLGVGTALINFKDTKTTDLGVKTSNPINIVVYRAQYWNDQVAKNATGDLTPDAEMVAPTPAMLDAWKVRWRALFPTSNVSVTVNPTPIEFDRKALISIPSNVANWDAKEFFWVFHDAVANQFPANPPTGIVSLIMFPSTTPIQNRAGNLVSLAGIKFAGRTNSAKHYSVLFMQPTGEEFTYNDTCAGRLNSVHEIGHMFGSAHGPACFTVGPSDLEWPNAAAYLGGLIGVNGWDISTYLADPLATPTLKDPSTSDLMGACCNTPWISDFNFTKWYKYLNP